ncbi:MAG: cytidine deaminase [Candidatus Hydrogenedentes bacterium]|nr:cytidine deaminase [Candidatus Hydrogenedentota bacterium]
MTLRFIEDYEALRAALGHLEAQGTWLDIGDNQKQFRHSNGGIMNWYPSTGTIMFQGRGSGPKALEDEVRAILDTESDPSSSQGQPGPVVGDDNPPPWETISTPIGTEPVETRPDDFDTTALSSASINRETAIGRRFRNSEIVIGLVGAVGTELENVCNVLKERLQSFGYFPDTISVSRDVIMKISQFPDFGTNEFDRIDRLMTAGDEAREKSGYNGILALGVAAEIALRRQKEVSDTAPRNRAAYIVRSLKHPEEVSCLRDIYGDGFYLLGVFADEKRRIKYLTKNKGLHQNDAEKLIKRDADEHLKHGQQTSKTFHLADFFLYIDENNDRMTHGIWRVLDLVFGHPYVTPTFDEYAMFMAFSAALRSADLSRQVGAVAAKGREILSTGANDCPKFGGGLYWPEYDSKSHEIRDQPGGRDCTLECDSNKKEKDKIVDDIVNRVLNKLIANQDGEQQKSPPIDKDDLADVVKRSLIGDITEYGRVVHAEMEALLSCARNNISTRGAHLYCTTFPCHNCAKHIIAAGIERVVYVEPYPKSKAAHFHPDSLAQVVGDQLGENTHVRFEPFFGVGPRRFFDFFSMQLSRGFEIERKDDAGNILLEPETDHSGTSFKWDHSKQRLRVQLFPGSYLDKEVAASYQLTDLLSRLENSIGKSDELSAYMNHFTKLNTEYKGWKEWKRALFDEQ